MTSTRRAFSHAIPRIRSGKTPGYASGKSFAAIWWISITTSCRNGWPRSACRAIASGPRRDSWRRPPTQCLSRSPSTAPSRITTPAACRSKARSPNTAIWARFFTVPPRSTTSRWRTAAVSSPRWRPSIPVLRWSNSIRLTCGRLTFRQATPLAIAHCVTCGTLAHALCRRWRGTAATAPKSANPVT